MRKLYEYPGVEILGLDVSILVQIIRFTSFRFCIFIFHFSMMVVLCACWATFCSSSPLFPTTTTTPQLSLLSQSKPPPLSYGLFVPFLPAQSSRAPCTLHARPGTIWTYHQRPGTHIFTLLCFIDPALPSI